MQYFKDSTTFVKGKQVFCGIDIHQKHWNVCLLCDGEVLERMRIPASYPQLLAILKRYDQARGLRVVYEAGFSGFWLYRNLKEAGYDCLITPPNKAPQSSDRVKTDKRDALKLARYLSAGILKAVYVPPSEVEADRGVVRRRQQLVKHRTRVKNQIRSFLHVQGIERPASVKTNWSQRYMDWLESLSFTYDADRFRLQQLVAHYQYIRSELCEVTRYLRYLSKTERYREQYKRLLSARGVGLITAMTFLLEIYDFGRFATMGQFASYLGLTPSQYSSGAHTRLGSITRQGNHHVRRVLVESAWTVIKHDPQLRDKYERIKQRGTNGKKAIVAVARSLGIRLRRCLLDQTDYVIGVC
jgi:transposase